MRVHHLAQDCIWVFWSVARTVELAVGFVTIPLVIPLVTTLLLSVDGAIPLVTLLVTAPLVTILHCSVECAILLSVLVRLGRILDRSHLCGSPHTAPLAVLEMDLVDQA